MIYKVCQSTSRPTDLPRQLGMIGHYIEILKISRFPDPLDNCDLVPFHWVHLFKRLNHDSCTKIIGRRGFPSSKLPCFPGERGDSHIFCAQHHLAHKRISGLIIFCLQIFHGCCPLAAWGPICHLSSRAPPEGATGEHPG
jgi:hypothetical protein